LYSSVYAVFIYQLPDPVKYFSCVSSSWQ